jgi:hypothetical protein
MAALVEENSGVIRALLYQLCPAVVANAEALSSNVMFFAASSFGHTPIKIKVGQQTKYAPDPTKLQPMFVEIPPLWILSQVCPNLFGVGQLNNLNG